MQIRELAPLTLLYGAPHADAPGLTWEKHWEELAEFVGLNGGRRVLEIGGGNGRLAENSMRSKSVDSWTILEPNPQETVFADTRISFELGWLDTSYRVSAEVDTIIFSHVFEHLHDPSEILDVLSNSGSAQIIVSFPDMRAGIARFDSNVLHFEHTYYADTALLRLMFGRFGYRLAARQEYGPGHSIFLCFEKGSDALDTQPIDERRTKFSEYFEHFFSEAALITAQVKRHRGPSYLSPASIFAQTFFGCGLDEGLFEGLLDNSPLKVGRRLYGTSLQAYSPQVLESLERPLVVLRAGVYSKEIRQQISEQINPNVVFV